MLLSRNARKFGNGWVACVQCRSSLSPRHRENHNPPKFAIANGFVIGHLPASIKRRNSTSPRAPKRHVNVGELNDWVKKILAPVRPYGYVFLYSGGMYQSIKGHFQYFETDRWIVSGAVNHVRDMGVSENMYIMLCGRMTPEQRQIMRRRVRFDTEEYIDILNYLIT